MLLKARNPERTTGLIVSCRQTILLLENTSVKSVMLVLGVFVLPSRSDSMFQDVMVREEILDLKTRSSRLLRTLPLDSNVEYRRETVFDRVS